MKFKISIHAPRVGSDGKQGGYQKQSRIFQSTLPVWGATREERACDRAVQDFNPRSPCGERPFGNLDGRYFQKISIHAPRVGSDGFQRGRQLAVVISIHAPRVGSDEMPEYVERGAAIFQSTLPVWGATR